MLNEEGPQVTVATILTGTGRYEDKWHDFPATSQQIAAVLQELGLDCRIRGTRASTLTDLGDTDVLIVNAGKGRSDPEFDEPDDRWESASESLRAYIGRGGAMVGVHTAANTFHGVGGWLDALGGFWEIGRSMHPPISDTTVDVRTDDHPITKGFAPFPVYDERYSYLVPTAEIQILATHEHDGDRHPLGWAREFGGNRVVYDALGHGVQSYESEGRRRLLKREVLWALGADAEELSRY
jgi:hypothetical protein